MYDWIQYQGSTQPVSTTPETVTESRWHQPWSEPPVLKAKIAPRLAIALIVSGLFYVEAQPFPETVTESRWHQPLSEPVRQKDTPQHQIARVVSGPVLVKADPFPETVTESRWHQPWSEPVRVKPALRTGDHPFFTAPPRIIVPQTFPPLNEPTRLSRAQPWNMDESPAVPTAPERYSWQQPWSQPLRAAARVASFDAGPFVYTPTGEVITVDKWFTPFADVVRKAGLSTAAQQALAYTGADPFPESVTEDRWHVPWLDPVRPKPQPAYADPSPYLFAPVTETITLDKWYVGLTDPVRVRPGLLAALQQTLAYSESAQFAESVTEDRWHWPWSEPVRFKPVPVWVDPSPYLFAPFTETVTVDKWYVALGEPVRSKPGLLSSLQQFLAYSESAQFAESVTEDRWHQPWIDPIRLRNLPAALQQALAYSPYFVAEVVTIDKWFEWLNDPVRVKLALAAGLNPAAFYVGAAPFGETVSFDKFAFPWAMPVRQRPGLGAPQQPAQQFLDMQDIPTPPPPPSGDQYRVSGQTVQNLFTHGGVSYPDAAITRKTNL